MRPSHILIPIVAAAVAVFAGDQGYGWPFIAMHFVIGLLIVGAFAILGSLLLGRR